MLSDFFLDWWFAPWRYAGAAGLPPPADLLAERDQYGWWCARAGVPAEVPAEFDPGWQAAALDAASLLRRAAVLFGGILAARGQDGPVLACLSLADRKWCMGIASTQPLKGCLAPGWHGDAAAKLAEVDEAAKLTGAAELAEMAKMAELAELAEMAEMAEVAEVAEVAEAAEAARLTGAAELAEMAGLTELARRLEHGFPGMWARLRLLLPAPLARQVDARLPAALAEPAPPAGSAARLQRCWQLCLGRAAGRHSIDREEAA